MFVGNFLQSFGDFDFHVALAFVEEFAGAFVVLLPLFASHNLTLSYKMEPYSFEDLTLDDDVPQDEVEQVEVDVQHYSRSQLRR